ncbi:MAG: energy-coupled thiamine transporter ThiT [Oscillospiraceae bacterium]|nr:energy-coupled thiamine transporter ThiT [Oscillospiraceae bacterium]
MKNQKTRTLCLGAVCIALALALSYIEIQISAAFGGFGGSIDFVMVPLIVFSMYAGAPWGIGAGFVFGIMKYLFANGVAVSWVSILFDYSVAYAAVGFAGLLRGRYRAMPLAALIGCAARFLVHFASGVTVYAQYMPEVFMDMPMTSPTIYSILYNGTYMLPNTVLAIAVCALLIRPMERLDKIVQM